MNCSRSGSKSQPKKRIPPILRHTVPKCGRRAFMEKKKIIKLSKSARSGLTFPVARIGRHLRTGDYSRRVRHNSAVYLSAVLEYLTAEIITVAGDNAKSDGFKIIKPKHLEHAIAADDELHSLMKNRTITEGGVVPNINPALINYVDKCK
jgi:histone H2A